MTAVSLNDTAHQQCSSLNKTYSSLVQLGALDLGDCYLVDCVALQNFLSWFVWNAKIADDSQYYSVPLSEQVFPESPDFVLHFLFAGGFLESLLVLAVL